MTFWSKLKTLLNILFLMILAYMVMVFISHFSVYNKSESYKVIDSFKAMLFQTDVPAEYILYFGIHIFIVLAVFLTINFISKKINSKTKKLT